MIHFRPFSLAEQVAAHIKTCILQGVYAKTLPGVHKLSAELGVHHTTAEEAVQILEKERLVESQGAGRKRRILSTENFAAPSMKMAILPYENTDRCVHFVLEMMYKLQIAGHAAGFTARTLQELNMDAGRVARFAKDIDVDAWIVISGPREVLEWFASQPKPAFSLFGRRHNIPIASAGPDKLPALCHAIDRLVELGHRKIVLLLREEHRKPKPGHVARVVLDTMQSHGLPTGPYNLPDWENNGSDLRRCLDSLFRITPPSAIIIDELFLFNVVQHHLARLGIFAPQDISLVCADPDPAFDWLSPSVAHIDWDSRRMIQDVVRWANNVARGKSDIRQHLTKATFIEGGTIGPCRNA